MTSNTNDANIVLKYLSDELNKLNPQQQNKIKNQMLRMQEIVTHNKITLKNLNSVLSQFTTSNNIEKTQQIIKSYELKSLHLNKSTKNANINLFESYPANFNYESNNNTTIGQLINKLNIATDVFAGISAAVIFAAVEYTLAFFSFGTTIPWAVASTAISVATGAVSFGCSIAAMHYQSVANQLPDGFDTAVTALSSAYSIGSATSSLIKLINICIVTVSLSEWAFW